jgi:hypothetical protein
VTKTARKVLIVKRGGGIWKGLEVGNQLTLRSFCARLLAPVREVMELSWMDASGMPRHYPCGCFDARLELGFSTCISCGKEEIRFCLSLLCDFLPGFSSRFLSERGLSSVV